MAAVFLHRFVDDGIEPARNSRVHIMRSERSLRENRVVNGCQTIALESTSPGRYLIKNNPKRK
jgi:hypothetical protein